MKRFLLIYLWIPFFSFSQTEVIKDTAIVNEILSKSKENVIDHIHNEVCMCIDSISSSIDNKSKNNLISDCLLFRFVSFNCGNVVHKGACDGTNFATSGR